MGMGTGFLTGLLLGGIALAGVSVLTPSRDRDGSARPAGTVSAPAGTAGTPTGTAGTTAAATAGSAVQKPASPQTQTPASTAPASAPAPVPLPAGAQPPAPPAATGQPPATLAAPPAAPSPAPGQGAAAVPPQPASGQPTAPAPAPSLPGQPSVTAPAPSTPGQPAATPTLRHMQIVDLPRGRALIAVVLAPVEGGADFVDLRLPVTAALAPDLPEAGRIAAAHAANGHEVAALIATAPGPEAAREAAAALPAAVAILAPAIPVAEAGPLAQALLPEGVGLVTGEGARDGLPPGTAPLLLRIAPGTPEAEIRRLLARVREEAVPGNGAIIFAPAEPAMLSAMLDWRMAAGAEIAFAPLSALLLEPR